MPCLQISRTSHPGTVMEAFNLNTPLIHIQPHWYFLSSLSFKRFGPTQSTSVGVAAATIFSAANDNSATCCWQIHLKFGSFGFFSLFRTVVFWCIPWTSLELIHGSLLVKGEVWILWKHFDTGLIFKYPCHVDVAFVLLFHHKPLYSWEYLLYMQIWSTSTLVGCSIPDLY